MKKKKHVTVPRIHNPGKGRPAETLAYLSPIEHEMIRKLTDGTWERGPGGIRSYADDSASSNGVSRGDNAGTKGSGGLGGGNKGSGGNAGGSKASGSPNSGTSTGGTSASKSGSQSQSSSTTGAGGQRGAGSNYGPGSARPGAPSTALGQASQAAQRNAVSTSAAMDQGIYHDGFSRKPGSPGFNSLPGMSNPTQFDRTIRPSGFKTAAGVKYDNFTNRYDPNKLDPGAQKIHQAIVDNAFRTNQPVEFFSGARPFNPKRPTKNHPSGTAIDIRMMDPVTGRPVGYDKIGEFARNPIGSYNPAAGRTVAQAQKIQGALAGPYRDFATGVLNSFMDNPGVYGDFNNQRWGGSFGTASWKTDPNALDYMHFDEGKAVASVNADQAALRKEAANYRGPTVSSGTMLAGGIPSGLGGTTPPAISRPTQVAGIANAGMGEAARLQKAQEALRTISAPSPTIPTDPRLNVPQGAYPAAPLRSAAGTYTAPYNPASQGPQRYSGPLDSIPSPNSIGMAAPASAFANDPRLNVPQGAYPARAQSMVAGDPRVGQTPLGGYPQARATSQVSTDPRVSQTPPGAFPAASRPASVFAEDPRLASPLGAYPAAPEKEVQLAWNVPPLGGALPSWKADALGVWGTNRKPSGPAAQPGTIHSQTAEAAPSTSWMDGLKKQAEGMGLDPDKIITVGTDAVQKLSEGNKKVAEAQQSPLGRLGLALMGAFGGPGGRSAGLLGSPQDRSDRYFAPPQMPQPMQPQRQMAQAPAQDQLSQLLLMQEQMIASGADPEELAAIQALIDQLSTQEA